MLIFTVFLLSVKGLIVVYRSGRSFNREKPPICRYERGAELEPA
jgi:hypothetical protein